MSKMSEADIDYQGIFKNVATSAQIYEDALYQIACQCKEDCCDEDGEVCIQWIAKDALKQAELARGK